MSTHRTLMLLLAAALAATSFVAAPADAAYLTPSSSPVKLATSAGQASSVPGVLRSPSDLSSEALTLSDSEGSDPSPEAGVQTRVARDPTDSAKLEGALIATLLSLKDVPKTVEDVTVVGSWSEWAEHTKLINKGAGRFEGLVDLPTGDHQFKFILDDEWICSEQWPVALADNGMMNNVIHVSAPAPALRGEPAFAGELASTDGGGVLGALVSVILFPFRAVLFVALAPFNVVKFIVTFPFRHRTSDSAVKPEHVQQEQSSE